jgi:hypothetical protein
MKCPNCGGTGKEYWNGNVFCNTGFECDKCNGTGEIELVQTNKEWLQTATTEQLADAFFAYRYAFATPKQKLWMSASEKCIKTDIIEWLKKPHSFK